MEKMKMDSPLDFAVFQLSPKRSRCELFVSGGGSTEKLASGLLKPFIAHLKIAEEQVASAAQSVKLEVGRRKNAESWFTKGTLERFVRFVSTPEILELVNTFDAEMSQLEAARRIYSQGAGDQLSGGSGSGATTADDATKKELLRAIDLRLAAVQQDLSSTCARADAAGFNVDTVSELQMFADSFGAHRLNEACGKFITVSERRPNLIRKPGSESRTVRSSCGSDMSIDDDDVVSPPTQNPATCHQSDPPPVTFPLRRAFSRESSVEERDDGNNKWNDAFGENEAKDDNPIPDQTGSTQTSHHVRRLSVQDRISLFENKQKENSGGKPVELRRLSSDVSAVGAAAAEKAVLRRWSGASDMSIDLGVEKKDVDDTVKSSSVVKAEIKVIPGLIRNNSENNFTAFTKSNCDAVSGGRSGLHDRMLGSKTQSRSSSISLSENQENSEERLNVFRGENVSDFLHGSQGKDQDCSLEKFTSIGNKGGREDSESTVETVEQTSLKSNRKNTGESGSRIREAFAARYKGIDNDSSSARRDVRSIEETEVVEKKELRSFEKVSSGSVSEVEDSGPRRMKFNRKANANGKSMTSFSGEIRAEAEEVLDSFSTPPPEQAQRAKRQSKGNQELNDELKMKANELEKLFAEHKLRAPGDQSNVKPNEPSGSSKNKTKSNDAPSSLMKAIDSKNYGDALKKSFSELSVSEGSRGKSYDMYIRKRDAKLKEDWSANRAEKEARLKSMQDSLERNRSEMKAKFSGSAHGSVSSSRRRAERLRSYNSRSIMNSEQYLGFGDSDDDEEASESIEKNYPREDKAFDDSSAQGKKLLPNNRNLSSSILPRTSAAPVPRSATKATNNSMKRRAQPENPLAQSVPNFSDLRKENTKPSVGSSKATRSQVRNYGRSKSTSEEAVTAKEDKSRRLQVVRKSSANPSESREMSPQDSDGVILTTIKFDEEVVTKNAGTKPFLKKGSRARTNVARYKASSLGSEPVRNVEENDDVAYAPDEAVECIVVKDEVDEEFEPSNTEDGSKILEAEEPIPIVNSGSEDGDDVTLGFSRVDQALGSQLPSESPISWNSHGQQHPYSYPHEMSDIDASVDSPVGSPLWSSHSLKQMEADRMRKKWGTAQKPTLIAAAAAHSSNNSSRKDMTRGFKRLLKFGRKSRGSENLVDWISATTSEGDDDTEDGRDIANRSSEDLRKSRMGFSQAQPSDYSFNESEFFNESVRSSLSSIPAPPPDFELREDHISGTSIKAPRSFFSLSTFRSKGSESKPR